jgi:Zinc knuckle
MVDSDQEDNKSGGKGNSFKKNSGNEKGYVYTYGIPGQTDRYIKTTKAIAEQVGKTYGKEMWRLVNDREETEFEEPKDPGDAATKGQLEKYKMLLKAHIDEMKEYKKQKAKVFRIIMGQCSPTMKNKIENLPDYEELEDDDDVVKLLTKMRELVYSTENVQYEYWTMQASMRSLMIMRQGEKESLGSFSKRFLAQLEVTESVWGTLSPMKLKGSATDLQVKARDKYLACVFLAGVDRSRYKSVLDDLNNDFLTGVVSYPEDVPGMVALLSNRRGGGASNKKMDAIRDGAFSVGFSQMDRKCYKCGKKGHIAKFCKEKEESDDDATSTSNGGTSSDDDRSAKSYQKKYLKKKKKNPSVGWSA